MSQINKIQLQVDGFAAINLHKSQCRMEVKESSGNMLSVLVKSDELNGILEEAKKKTACRVEYNDGTVEKGRLAGQSFADNGMNLIFIME